MIFADALTIDTPKRTSDGYLAVRAKAARSGIYQYLGREVDPEGTRFAADQVVNVYRSDDEVFDEKAVASFLMKPVTDNHPMQPVTADNWQQHAKGVVGRALRDGEHLAFDIVLMDAATIKAVEGGKRELSNGYACDFDFTDGTTPDGRAYQAVQRHIRGNHVAIVDRGRAGSTCRIGDAATCETIPSDAVKLRTYSAEANGGNVNPERSDTSEPNTRETALDGGSHVATKTITVDGLPIEVTDAAEAVIRKLEGQIADAASAKTEAETALAAGKTELAAKDTEIATLKQAVEDAKVTPAQLRDAAKAYAAVCDKARALKIEFAEDADADAIKRAVVDSRMGDVAKDWTAEQVAASFEVLAKDAKSDPLRDAIKDAQPQGDEREAAYTAMVADLESAWKPKAA